MEINAKVYLPEIEVHVIKTVARTTTDGGTPVSDRFKGSKREINLTPWMAESSGVRTSKSVREPAGGFSITLIDRMHPEDFDSLYGLIEPMDLVEIRFSHEPHKKFQNGGKLPIIMRGFIANVRRSEGMSANGKPQRQIVITGQDYGKIWQIMQIFYMPNYVAGQNLITNFKLFAQYGVGFKPQPAKDFLKDVIQMVVNPFLSEMRGQGEDGSDPNESPIKGLTVDDADLQTGNGVVAPFGINQWNGGTIYQLLHTYLDVGPFCELFLEDREDGIHVVYRQNPFYSLNGDKIPEYDGKSGFDDPAVINVDAGEIISISVSRSDENLANYYWVDCPRHELNYGPYQRLAAAQGKEEDFFIQKQRNSNPKIYGIRKMWEVTNQGNPAERSSGNGTKSADNQAGEILSGKWIGERRKQLVAQNKDNVVFEHGNIRMRGREDIKAGCYIMLRRGNMFSTFYVVQVDHEFVPFGGFITNLMVERGTGFSERAKRAGGVASPYYSELSDVRPGT